MKIQKSQNDIKIILFTDQKKWNDWLDKNFDSTTEVWVRIAKKGSEVKSVSYKEALETALCYGWIDGQKNRFDESSWIQKFTPRTKKSIWSKINRKKAEELIEQGKMKKPGLDAIELAKNNGRWDTAYDSQSRAELPDDLKIELDKNPKAKAFFETLNSVNRYAIIFRTQTAVKKEIRTKRIQQFIKMLERKEKLHP